MDLTRVTSQHVSFLLQCATAVRAKREVPWTGRWGVADEQRCTCVPCAEPKCDADRVARLQQAKGMPLHGACKAHACNASSAPSSIFAGHDAAVPLYASTHIHTATSQEALWNPLFAEPKWGSVGERPATDVCNSPGIPSGPATYTHGREESTATLPGPTQ
eukprot:365819-Chlamydomonas_euryale.AAC.3